MDNSLDETIKSLLGIEDGSTIDLLIDNAMSATPYISGAYNAYKMQRFKKRLDLHEKQLSIIGNKINLLEDKSFKAMIQHTIFPYILDDLIEEHQEKKVNYIINGFNYVVDEEINDEAYIISYYDTLRVLRVEDIKRLLEYDTEFLIHMKHNVENKRRELKHSDDKLFYEQESYRQHIDYKLESKGLIGYDREEQNNELLRFIEGEIKENIYGGLEMAQSIRKSVVEDSINYHITGFGGKLIDVFGLKMNPNDYET
ncbi:hypothetical protein [Virgibacillus doumboii]|uniref:hypothetical protein n=1 Tax=Virgibacillus doumboii TaxID=2697503 RepID=UPI0013DF514C|nr:hypothetical protein [Virgibacillus doumboii]